MHTIRRTLITPLALVLILALAAPLTVGPAAADIAIRQDEPVTFYDFNNLGSTLADLDPQVGMSVYHNWSDALFLGLMDYDPLTTNTALELAQHWDVDATGTVWTFTLRDDVPWVRWDPVAGEAVIVRMVTAGDVVYGIQRACDPRTESGHDALIVDLIVGCGDLAAQDPMVVSNDDYDQVGVRALDDTTLEIRLTHTAGYLLTLLPMPNLYPVPPEIIAEHGEEWTQPGVIVTNGPFVLDQWREDVWILRRNPHFPADLVGPGNVERVVLRSVGFDEVLDLYIADELDVGTTITRANEVRADPVLSAQRHVAYQGITYYVGMAMDLPPLDNVHVRRALSAAVDRDLFNTTYLPSGMYPMIHFTAPGVMGAPPIDEPGVGFDPAYAREQLALAGYPGCDGLPSMTMIAREGFGFVADFLNAQFGDVLGCQDVVQGEEIAGEGYDLLIGPNIPQEFRPHLWVSGWGPDYPDANGALEILHCAGWNESRRSCNEVDDLIDQAAREPDIAVRTALYYDIEQRLFGPEGEFPLIPINVGGSAMLFKPWVAGPLETDWTLGGLHYDWYTIDQEVQLAARGG